MGQSMIKEDKKNKWATLIIGRFGVTEALEFANSYCPCPCQLLQKECSSCTFRNIRDATNVYPSCKVARVFYRLNESEINDIKEVIKKKIIGV